MMQNQLSLRLGSEMKDSVKEADAINEVSQGADEYEEYSYYDEEDYGEQQEQQQEVVDEVIGSQNSANG